MGYTVFKHINVEFVYVKQICDNWWHNGFIIVLFFFPTDAVDL